MADAPLDSWNTAKSAEAVPMVPARIIYPSSALHGITAWEKKIRAILKKKKLGMWQKFLGWVNFSGEHKRFPGISKMFSGLT